jgi:putative colanic acid biosynthesis glycosyltransferase
MRYSIITVCRNNLNGLQRTCESIEAQSFSDFEWIVIDGASTDGTVEFMTNKVQDNISFFSEPDEGLYDAMNKGIDKASGDYLIFMNSGDQFMSGNSL